MSLARFSITLPLLLVMGCSTAAPGISWRIDCSGAVIECVRATLLRDPELRQARLPLYPGEPDPNAGGDGAGAPSRTGPIRVRLQRGEQEIVIHSYEHHQTGAQQLTFFGFTSWELDEIEEKERQVRHAMHCLYQRLRTACPELPPWESLRESVYRHKNRGFGTGWLAWLALAACVVLALMFVLNRVSAAMDRRSR